ncbi:serine carboxypeptidase-like 13 [Striga asiatica]|uniref:Serine carboxypeptidase-like 13 n=1 Tax=Striga asiatica TaxID=4170 RepID=A0A5A7RFJ2_STRAF|nr:serine carboxypeptidase-like 13 [Striga asiatica]
MYSAISTNEASRLTATPFGTASPVRTTVCRLVLGSYFSSRPPLSPLRMIVNLEIETMPKLEGRRRFLSHALSYMNNNRNSTYKKSRIMLTSSDCKIYKASFWAFIFDNPSIIKTSVSPLINPDKSCINRRDVQRPTMLVHFRNIRRVILIIEIHSPRNLTFRLVSLGYNFCILTATQKSPDHVLLMLSGFPGSSAKTSVLPALGPLSHSLVIRHAKYSAINTNKPSRLTARPAGPASPVRTTVRVFVFGSYLSSLPLLSPLMRVWVMLLP